MVKREPNIQEATSKIVEIWSLLTEEQQKLLQENIIIRKYKKNEIIYNEGETPRYLICLLSGKAKIHKDGVGGRSQIIRVFKPVEYFGYRSFFCGTNFISSASAFEASTVCLIPLSILMQIIEKNYQVAMFFIRQLAYNLGVSDSRTVSLTQKHIRARLAESLLFLKNSYGLEEDGSTLSIYLSREDLANLSNMTTSNAIRTLSAFANEKLVAIDGRKIKIIEFSKLQEISQLG